MRSVKTENRCVFRLIFLSSIQKTPGNGFGSTPPTPPAALQLLALPERLQGIQVQQLCRDRGDQDAVDAVHHLDA